jgi:4-hydroxy 2-oxovalerate aldolase
MGRISLLDCTLRDGGYINNWQFGEDAIRFIIRKLNSTGIEYIEVGFLKECDYSPDRTIFPCTAQVEEIIAPKCAGVTYVGMIDMINPLPLEKLEPCNGRSVDAIRIIFKQDRVAEGYEYAKAVKDLGYRIMIQLVSTNTYSDEEFIDTISLFNDLEPESIYIVDSLGVIKRRQFLRLVYLADNNMDPGIALGYHSHNNLQQAMGNAEAFVELRLTRDILIDACVFGMGRGAGNLNMELFAGYMNEFQGGNYLIEPMLEIIDEYLDNIHRKHFWGYSLPFYLTASNGCHPNYGSHYSEKKTLTEKAFNELLKTIPEEKKAVFSKSDAEEFYRLFMENYIDDRSALSDLTPAFADRKVLVIAPGRSLEERYDDVRAFIDSEDPVIVAVNFTGEAFEPDYVFSSNMRRYSTMTPAPGAKRIVTSNMKDAEGYDYMINFSSYSCKEPEIIDNSGIMLLKLLQTLGLEEVCVAGMDGYDGDYTHNYCEDGLDYRFPRDPDTRNNQISDELSAIRGRMRVRFLTPTKYSFGE